ncbi:hypothetical protein [Gordonia sp. ABSL49_1]|uniref:hypothetical protein n=1 Tax=Gordonia sp. ABSL49_1 TaxID=2920941 RepID=UPI001F0EA483|nr:hypothetical protein [Gordonia sp. ABSL49_1]MCH5642068.1 hypothetical protein [Gordonia sp. ABSL49_1]
MTSAAQTIYLADHSVLLAIPALLPVAIIVIVILVIVIRDRRAEALEEAMAHEALEDESTTPENGQASEGNPDDDDVTKGDS